MLTVKNTKRFDKNILLVAAGLALIGLVGYLVVNFYNSRSTPVVITTAMIDDIASKGTLARNDNKPTTVTEQTFQAQPNEELVYTAESTRVENKANAAVFDWGQTGSEGVLVEVRTRNNDKWSDWAEVEPLDGGKDGTESDESASALVLADEIDNFQFRIELNGSAEKSSARVDVADSSLEVIDSSDGPTGEATPIEKLAGVINPQASAATNTPKVISRSAWGSPEPNRSTWKPEYAKLKQAVVHHTATTESSNSYSDMRAIWQYHARNLGWGDIGYHYVVDSKGRIFEGRYQDKAYARATGKEVIGGHTYGHNEGTVGISAIGDYRYKRLSKSTRESISKLIGYKLAQVNVSPRSKNAVVGHYSLTSTSCPGTNIISQLGSIRTISNSRFTSYRPSVFTPLGTFNWMDTTKRAHKYDPLTGEQATGLFAANRRIKFADTITKKGVTYYRTAIDARKNRQLAFKASELELASSIPFTKPRYMRLSRSTSKVNPIVYDASASSRHPAGTIAKFVEKITIDGKTYYRTQADTNGKRLTFFDSSKVKDIPYKTFSTSRYMRAKIDTNLVNPITGQTLPDTVEAGQDILYTHKIYVNGWYYQSANDNANNVARAIPAAAVTNIPLTPLPEPYYVTPSETTYKYSLRTLSPTKTPLTNEKNPFIEVVAEMTIDGRKYLQTKHSAGRSEYLGIPVDTLETVTHSSYIPMSVPRKMQLTADTQKIRPFDGLQSSEVYEKGLTLDFDTKVTVNGVLYLRTNLDTEDGIDAAFPYSALDWV